MRRRDPRRLIRRRRQARARVTIVREEQRSPASADGSVTTKQVADVTLPRAELERIWSPAYLERLARTYWRFLTRISLGLLRVLYSDDAREVGAAGAAAVLLRFHAPEYEAEADRGAVTWRIDRGLLVAPAGRSRGYLRISVDGRPRRDRDGDEVTGRVSSEVANFYPTIGGWGWFARIGRHLYAVTQLRIHVIVTHAFLRSLARLDLAESRVGALAARLPDAVQAPSSPGLVRTQSTREPISSRSFGRSWVALMRRTVPERERITSDSVVAPSAVKRTPCEHVAVGDAGRREEDVVAGDEAVGVEHLGEVVAGVDRGLALGRRRAARAGRRSCRRCT